MEFVFEIIVQFLGEILLQVGFETLAELGAHGLEETLKKPKSPVLATIGFLVWGAAAGVISLLILPTSPIADPTLRRVNLLVSPLVAGAVLALIGRGRRRRGASLVRLDRFGYAFCFALAMAAVRYVGAR